MSKRQISLLLLCLVILTSLVGCGEAQTQPKATPKQQQLTYTLGSDDWSVLAELKASPEVMEAYQFATYHPEVLDYMPCYCGCYEHDGHIGNTDCFVQSIDGDKVVLDTMGLA